MFEVFNAGSGIKNLLFSSRPGDSLLNFLSGFLANAISHVSGPKKVLHKRIIYGKTSKTNNLAKTHHRPFISTFGIMDLMLTIPILLTIIVTVAAAVLLFSELLRPDLVALIVMLVLGLSGTVSHDEVFAGFSGSAVMTILGISIISHGLYQTGVTHWLGRWMSKVGGKSEKRLVLIIMLTSATVSLFMNNIAAVGVLLPAVLGLSRYSRVSPRRVLMPLAFGTTLGGMATLLTTSNIVVSGALRDAGYKPFGLLDFFPTGGPVALVGILFMVTIGISLIPRGESAERQNESQHLPEELSNLYHLAEDLVEIQVLAGCPLAGRTIAEAQWACETGLNILAIRREDSMWAAVTPQDNVYEHDHLLAQGEPSSTLFEQLHLKLLQRQDLLGIFSNGTMTLAEMILTPHSRLIGRSLQDLKFREKYGLDVVALWRKSLPVRCAFSETKLQFGDALLVQGSVQRIHDAGENQDLVLLEEDPDAIRRPNKRLLAMLLTITTLVVASTGLLPVAEVALAGAVLMIITGCLNLNEAYQAIEWKVIFLIAGMWPLSTAIRETGLAELVVKGVFNHPETVIPLIAAAAIILMAFILTQFMSGQVASLVLAPLAISAAVRLGVDPRGLAMGVALGCSLAFATPFGHPVNIMVMTPGGYRFKDYLRVGTPLTLLAFFMILAGLHWIWGI